MTLTSGPLHEAATTPQQLATKDQQRHFCSPYSFPFLSAKVAIVPKGRSYKGGVRLLLASPEKGEAPPIHRFTGSDPMTGREGFSMQHVSRQPDRVGKPDSVDDVCTAWAQQSKLARSIQDAELLGERPRAWPQMLQRICGTLAREEQADVASEAVPMAEGRATQASLQQEITAAYRLANSTYSLYDSHKKYLWIADNRRQRYLTRALPAVWSRSDPSGKSAHGGDLPQAVH